MVQLATSSTSIQIRRISDPLHVSSIDKEDERGDKKGRTVVHLLQARALFADESVVEQVGIDIDLEREQENGTALAKLIPLL